MLHAQHGLRHAGIDHSNFETDTCRGAPKRDPLEDLTRRCNTTLQRCTATRWTGPAPGGPAQGSRGTGVALTGPVIAHAIFS
jgi:hypothetical protein